MRSTSVFFQPVEALNETQKNIIEGVLKFYLDDISEELKPSEAINALKAMTAETVLPDDIATFKQKNVWDTINTVRKILSHPCPQNRKVGNYAAALGVVGRRVVGSELQDGVVNGRVYYFTEGFGSGLRSEPQGCLGLTARNDSTAPEVTKDAVVNFIHQLVQRAIAHQLRLINSEQNENEIREEKDSVRSCMDSRELISRNKWLVCLAKDEQNKKSILYLEGVRESGEPFLDRYQVVSSLLGSITVRAQSIFPRVFNGQEGGFQISKIDDVQGRVLKNSIRSDVMNYVERLGVTSRASTASSSSGIDYGTTWTIQKLSKIDVVVDEAMFKPKKMSICSIM